jgi:hypothetical protein
LIAPDARGLGRAIGSDELGRGGLAAWRSRNGERLANVTQTIETILAAKPFDIAASPLPKEP